MSLTVMPTDSTAICGGSASAVNANTARAKNCILRSRRQGTKNLILSISQFVAKIDDSLRRRHILARGPKRFTQDWAGPDPRLTLIEAAVVPPRKSRQSCGIFELSFCEIDPVKWGR